MTNQTVIYFPCVHGKEIHECELEHYLGCNHCENIADCEPCCISLREFLKKEMEDQGA